MERVELLPDGGQILVLEHDHELPVVITAALHHRPVGVESVEQEQLLGVTGFVLADGALQEFLRPEGVARELL